MKLGRNFPRRNGMDTVKQSFEVVPSSNGFAIHETDEPAQGTILDSHEKPIASEKFVGVRYDEKTKAVTASPVVTAIIGVVLLALGYFSSSLLHYQTVADKADNNERRIEKLEVDTAKISDIVTSVALMQKDVEIVKKNQTDGDEDRKAMLKNLSDIKIFLAQKELGK